jgi:hypothetical protein
MSKQSSYFCTYLITTLLFITLFSHKLASFQPFDQTVLSTDHSESMSSVWTDALQG